MSEQAKAAQTKHKTTKIRNENKNKQNKNERKRKRKRQKVLKAIFYNATPGAKTHRHFIPHLCYFTL